MHETAGQDDVARLLEFLRGRDVPCPLCRYNLRDLTRPQCPECRHELVLTVGVTKPRFLWFLLAITLCTFAGIAAVLLLIPTGPRPPPFIALHALAWLSALGGLVLVRYRFAFLRQTPNRQRICTAAVWGIHGLAFLAFLTVLFVL